MENCREVAAEFYDHYRKVTRYKRRITESSEDNSGMIRMLDALNKQERCSLKQLCNILGIAKPTGSLMVEKAVKEGYVDRQPSKKDRRKIVLTLTKEGQIYITGIVEKQQDNICEAFEVLSDEDIMQLSVGMHKVEMILDKIYLLPEE